MLCTAVRKLKCLVGSTYERVTSGESTPSGLGTAWLQDICTAIPTKIADDVTECVQASHDVINCVMTQVLVLSLPFSSWMMRISRKDMKPSSFGSSLVNLMFGSIIYLPF